MEMFDFFVLFRVLIRKLWLLILIPVLAAVVAYVMTSGIPDRYKSTAQLTTGFTTNDQISLTNDGGGIRDAGIKFNNLIETMKSELVLSLVSYQLMLHDLTDPVPFRKFNPKIHRTLTQEEIREIISICKNKSEKMELLSSFEPSERNLIDLLSSYGYSNWQMISNLDITRVKDTDYVKISYISEDPMLSAFVVNKLSEEFIRYDNNIKFSRSGQSVTFFENLVKETKRTLDEKTQLLNSYRSSNNVINYTVETSSRISEISDYQLKRSEAISTIQGLRLSIANVDKKLASLTKVQSTSNSNSTILKIKSKIEELSKIYTDGGSTDASLQKTITDLRYDLQVEMDRLASLEGSAGQSQAGTRLDLDSKKNQYELELEIAEANLASINSTLAALNNSVSGIANKEVTISVLMGEVDNASKEYNEALDRYNTEKNKALIAASPIRLAIAGQPNGYPEPSKRWLLIGFSSAASFVLCVLSIVGIELIDLKLKNPVQFRKFVAINLAGSINQINAKKLNLDFLFNNPVKSKELEAFKHFLRKLRFEVESTNARTFLVTSTKNGEGKTLVILCLAYSLSLVKKKVLIIDTNFKHNSLTQELLAHNTDHKKLEANTYVKGLLGKPNPNEMSEEDFVDSIISPTGHRGINIIGNSEADSSPSEIFAGRDFRKMMLELSRNYDYIFLEGSSLNNYSDAKELVEYVDKVIPVFSASSVIKQIDRESINYLKDLNGKLMGAVLNGIEMKEFKK